MCTQTTSLSDVTLSVSIKNVPRDKLQEDHLLFGKIQDALLRTIKVEAGHWWAGVMSQTAFIAADSREKYAYGQTKAWGMKSPATVINFVFSLPSEANAAGLKTALSRSMTLSPQASATLATSGIDSIASGPVWANTAVMSVTARPYVEEVECKTDSVLTLMLQVNNVSYSRLTAFDTVLTEFIFVMRKVCTTVAPGTTVPDTNVWFSVRPGEGGSSMANCTLVMSAEVGASVFRTLLSNNSAFLKGARDLLTSNMANLPAVSTGFISVEDEGVFLSEPGFPVISTNFLRGLHHHHRHRHGGPGSKPGPDGKPGAGDEPGSGGSERHSSSHHDDKFHSDDQHGSTGYSHHGKWKDDGTDEAKSSSASKEAEAKSVSVKKHDYEAPETTTKPPETGTKVAKRTASSGDYDEDDYSDQEETSTSASSASASSSASTTRKATNVASANSQQSTYSSSDDTESEEPSLSRGYRSLIDDSWASDMIYLLVLGIIALFVYRHFHPSHPDAEAAAGLQTGAPPPGGDGGVPGHPAVPPPAGGEPAAPAPPVATPASTPPAATADPAAAAAATTAAPAAGAAAPTAAPASADPSVPPAVAPGQETDPAAAATA